MAGERARQQRSLGAHFSVRAFIVIAIQDAKVYLSG